MWKRSVHQFQIRHVLLRLMVRLLNGHLNIGAFGHAKSYASLFVPDHERHAESHALTSFRHARDTSKIKNRLFKFTRFTLARAARTTLTSASTALPIARRR